MAISRCYAIRAALSVITVVIGRIQLWDGFPGEHRCSVNAAAPGRAQRAAAAALSSAAAHVHSMLKQP
jgi:hypothetical protein